MDWGSVSAAPQKDENSSQFDEDLDLAMALSLQAESTDYEVRNGDKKTHGSSSKPLGLTDPQWELIDPNPDIRCLFLEFNTQFFFGKLCGVEVRWSPQMTLCAGLCCYEGRGGLCSVRLSLPLLKLRPRSDLVETLLHEMIHAYLFITANNRDHDAHGPQFLSHMNRINKEAGTKISVYHSFHDEVDYQRKHWWKCDGPCSQRRPFFGIVKRAKNRAPGPNDRWWSQHQSTCGGKFTKIVEPENYKQKNLKRKQVQETKEGKSSANIKSFFQPSTSSDLTPSSAKKKKEPSEMNNVKSIFSKEDNLIALDRNEFKPPFPHKSMDSSSNIPTPFSGQGFVLGSSKTPTSLLSKIRKELGYTPLNAPNSKSDENQSFRTGINYDQPKELIKKSKEQIKEGKVLKSLTKSETRTNSDASGILRKSDNKQTTSELLQKSDAKPNVREVKKEKLPKGYPKKFLDAAPNSASDAKGNKMKQGSLDKFVNSSPKGLERLSTSQEESSSAMVLCPVCFNSFTNSDINTHLDQCLVC